MGWRHVALEDIAKIVGGSTPRRDNAAFWNGDIPWLTPTDLPPLGSGVTNIADTASHITKDGFRSSSLTLLPPATVVFSSRATIGKVGVTEVPITTNQGFVNLIPSADVDPRYLAWALFHHADQIAALSGSTTFKEVSRTSVKKFRIPLPPLEEQRRIAHLLDEADRLQRLRREANEKAQRILPTLFVEMFGDPESNPMGWEVKPLSATGSTVRYGMSVPPSPSPNGTPMLRATDFSRGVIDGSSLVRVDISTVPESKRFLLDSSDVIVVRSGAYTGDVAQVTSEFAQCLAGYDLVVSPSPVVVPEYLEQYLLLPQIQDGYFKPQSARSGQPHLNSKQLLATPLILPSVEAQERFADAVEGVRAARKNGVLAQNAISSVSKTLGSRLFAEAT